MLKLENQSSDVRGAIASRIIGNCMAGVIEEDELGSLSMQPWNIKGEPELNLAVELIAHECARKKLPGSMDL